MPRERRRVSSSSSTSSTSSTTSSSSTSSYSTVASDPEITNSDPAITAVEPNSPNTVEVIFQRATTEHANNNQQTLPETPVNESSQQEQSVTKPEPPQLADAQNNITTSSSSLKAGMDTASAIDERCSSETHTKEEKTEVVPHISDEKFEDNAQNDAKCTPQKVAPKTEQQPCMNPAAITDIQNQKLEPGKQNDEKRETISLTDVTDTGTSCTDVATASNAKPNDQVLQESTENLTETTRSSDESSQQVTEADKNVETIGNELAPADTETCEVESVKNQVSVDPKEPDARNIASESGTKSPITNVDPNGKVVSESTQKQ
ncbi:unnamed protein product, partial [Anisakis simplex]|uniref:Mucin-5AC-like n=1 Tax=Anisakis simplex TaxID=6269 RepID=A0A0M3JDS7_ANISI